MNETTRRIRVGTVIVLAAIGLALMLVVLKGAASLFGETVTLDAAFEDVTGLVPGASVRLAGMQIGQVSRVYLPEKQNEVVVVMSVDERYLDRIREDSVATIDTRGLLGDPLIEISLGSETAPAVHDGDRLKSQGPRGIAEVVAALETGAKNVEEISNVVRDRLETVLTPDLATDVNRIARSLANVMAKVEQGHGLAHNLIYDEQLAKDAGGTMASARRALTRLDRAVDSAERILDQVEHGDGLAHAAIYDERARDAFAELSGALEELHGLMGDVRKGAGGEGIGRDLSDAAATLRRILDEVDHGQGTIGGLLKDPQIYHDLREVLGEVKRNVILKAIVRMTIAKDGLKRE